MGRRPRRRPLPYGPGGRGFKDALCHVPLHPEEVRFCCADLGAQGFVVFWQNRGMGFRGRAFPLVFCRVASFLARTSQALLQPHAARLQFYIDDPVVVTNLPGPLALATFDIWPYAIIQESQDGPLSTPPAGSLKIGCRQSQISQRGRKVRARGERGGACAGALAR